MTDESYGETTRQAEVETGVAVEGEAVMEGVEHLGKYVFDMQSAKFEALKAGDGRLPTREVGMVDVDAGEDGEGEEDVLIPDDEEEEEDVEVMESGRHLEVEATSSVRLD